MPYLPVLAVLLFSASVLAQEHAAHVHGIAKLQVAVDGSEINVHLETPLESVLGFEHAPGNDKERAIVTRMRKTLANGSALFTPTPAAQCRFVDSQIEAPKLEAPTLNTKPAAHHEAHGDLDADFRFTCAAPTKLTGMEVRLFDAFSKMRRIDAQVVTGNSQSASKLSTKMRLLSW